MRATSSGGGARASLIDVQTLEGDLHYWSDRTLANVPAAITADDLPALVSYKAWILQPPTFKRYRSSQLDTGSFTVQNIFGDTLAREMERTLRRTAMEGALFVYRYWNAAAEQADLEFHGKLSVSSVDVSSVTFRCKQLFDTSSSDAASFMLSETCQLTWGEKRCGATGSVECKYSWPTCQVEERFTGISNTYYDKNFAEAIGKVSTQQKNRRRGI